ncbi:hypothetical protein Leryth_006649 [Lithospermum erythrorhizon]|nr:hypothetical protein Leryth_006649 [Lithospermum erythrorhizon]
MKPSPKPIKSSRIIPIFSRVFPHKFRFLSNGSLSFAPKSRNINFNNSVVRGFSTRRRSGLGSGHESVKSLVDDEADLSDWVSGLSSKDYAKTKLISDSDNDNDNGGFNDGYGKGRDREMEMRGDRDGKRRKENGFERRVVGREGREGWRSNGVVYRENGRRQRYSIGV